MPRWYTAFGSGVSTEISPAHMFGACRRVGYTAFGSGVSTEIVERAETYGNRSGVHSLRLRGEH